ncbi:MAG: UDP-N-acetylmuramate--L-alanine ligase [Bacteroidales bacterium]|jgi:UDP-N-acetylmuramate--alanine ligase|nr:UDP-N-acetylmuramate--L-alanine ligase [Bacteroidales bacterium]
MSLENVYFIGIGGIGMSAIARYYKHRGKNVSGYDKTESHLTDKLESEGIKVHYEDDPDLLPKNKENTLVIYTPAVPSDMKEMQYAADRGYRVVKRSRALGEITRGETCLAVAGTHGKTTTSTMIAHIFTSSGTGCSGFLGGISKNYHTNLLLGHNDVIIAEADEFDRSFLQLFPHIAVITSADADHLDIYGNIGALREAFGQFASQIDSGGFLVKKKNAMITGTEKIKARIFEYSYDEKCDFYASGIKALPGGYFKFDINYPAFGEKKAGSIKDCTTGIPGMINVENSIAAAAVAILYGIDAKEIKKALATFSGVERRLDVKISRPGFTYIDDYAHHPKEISAAIRSLREMFPGRKISGIFQPHLYSRTRDFANDFADSLGALDELILLDIYPAREKPIPGITSKIIFDKVKITEKTLLNKENLMDFLKTKKFDILITFGAGNISDFIDPITKMFEKA